MVDLRATIDRPIERARIEHRTLDHAQIAAALRLAEVFTAAGAEIVKHGNAVPVGDQPIDQMAADKTGTAGNENSAAHARDCDSRSSRPRLASSERCAASSIRTMRRPLSPPIGDVSPVQMARAKCDTTRASGSLPGRR